MSEFILVYVSELGRFATRAEAERESAAYELKGPREAVVVIRDGAESLVKEKASEPRQGRDRARTARNRKDARADRRRAR